MDKPTCELCHEIKSNSELLLPSTLRSEFRHVLQQIIRLTVHRTKVGRGRRGDQLHSGIDSRCSGGAAGAGLCSVGQVLKVTILLQQARIGAQRAHSRSKRAREEQISERHAFNAMQPSNHTDRQRLLPVQLSDQAMHAALLTS